ncbi:MAG: malto-oligosyltrehalose trehalohydrolase [Acidimicrobiales bacterium]
MHCFSVWAPRAERVDVLIGGQRYPMLADPEAPETRPGWWRTEVNDAGPGTDYLFSIDGGPGRPDPRSAYQPTGVHGPSRVVDQTAFSWTDGSWRGRELASAVLYELHVGTFTPEGTFTAAIDRLEHLTVLGIDFIEVMPVAEASGDRGWGYDGVSWFAPHHAYGGPDGLKAFVDSAHGAGIGVILDVVYNHLGPEGNYLAEIGPYFTDRYRTNWGDALNFDGEYSDEVRRLVLDNAKTWLAEYHFDGLRLDAVHAIADQSATHLLEQLADEVGMLAVELDRLLWLIAESDLNSPVLVRPPAEGGYGLDAAWADEFHHALHAVLTGEQAGYYEDFGSLDQLATALCRAWVYAGQWSPHRKRTHGRDPRGLSSSRHVVFMQNHDQIGNRARGDRIGEQAGCRRAKVGAALVLLSPFVPLVFQGEEWCASSPFQYFTDHRDQAVARAVSEGRRTEFSAFGWDPADIPDPQDPASFERSKLDWSELALISHREIFEWYRELISLRKRVAGLAGSARGLRRTRLDKGEGWLAVERPGVVVVANLGRRTVTVLVRGRVGTRADDREATADALVLVLGSEPEVSYDGSSVVLPPDSVAVLCGKTG